MGGWVVDLEDVLLDDVSNDVSHGHSGRWVGGWVGGWLTLRTFSLMMLVTMSATDMSGAPMAITSSLAILKLWERWVGGWVGGLLYAQEGRGERGGSNELR